MIRDATLADIPQLVDLGRQMAAESPRYSRLPYSAEKLDRLFRHLVESPNGFLMLWQDRESISGSMAGCVAEHWMSTALIATDFGVYVNSSRRGGVAAAGMIKRFIAWASAMGAVDTTLGISTEVNVEQTACFYKALGLRQFGLLFEVP